MDSMERVIIEFHNKPKCVFDDAVLGIHQNDMFFVSYIDKKCNKVTHLYPFNSVLCATTEKPIEECEIDEDE